MANGGIYDQLGGGFARYATDNEWRIPHFEKMLYDNAQLISLYSKAYQFFENNEYKQVVDETISFIKREMMSNEDGFFTALDADSNGEEGKYYVWTKTVIDKALGDYSSLFCQFYNINGKAKWENDKNILMRTGDNVSFALKNNLPETEWASLLSKLKRGLLHVRE